MQTSDVWSTGKGRQGLRLKIRSGLLLTGLVMLLAGCEGRGCFGLCDEKDEEEDPVVIDDPEMDELDLSCYSSGTLDAQTAIPYDTEADAEQLLRFYAASSASAINPRPVLVWVTGDTWQLNTAVGDVPGLALNIARRLGIHFAAVSYRQSDTADWPAQVIDVKTAIRFLRAENERLNYNIDIDQIYIGGDQAGSALAALAALGNSVQEFQPELFPEQPDTISLLITLGGLYDFQSILDDNDTRPAACSTIEPNINALAVRRLFDCAEAAEGADALSECDANELRDASPLQYVGASVPALFYHGELDCEFPVAQSQAFDAAFGATDADTVLRDRAIYGALADDTNDLESLLSATVLEDLVGFDDFDCDNDI